MIRKTLPTSTTFLFAAVLVACGEPETEPLPDSGGVLDAGAGTDTAGLDATAPDIGTPDSGVWPDAMVSEDAGEIVDAQITDTGSVQDTGVLEDAGLVVDAGVATATSCSALKLAEPSTPSGTYVLDRDGTLSATYCEMDVDGGGWTLALLKNSAHDGAYPDFGAQALNVVDLSLDPAVASTSTIGIVAWLDLNGADYSELRLAAYSNGTRSYLSESIARSSLRIAFGESGYYLYDDPNGYFWCGGARSYTDDGVGQVNPPAGATADCKTHTVLGSGFDFGGQSYNTQLTMCGNDGYRAMLNGTGAWVAYRSPGAAYAFFIR